MSKSQIVLKLGDHLCLRSEDGEQEICKVVKLHDDGPEKMCDVQWFWTPLHLEECYLMPDGMLPGPNEIFLSNTFDTFTMTDLVEDIERCISQQHRQQPHQPHSRLACRVCDVTYKPPRGRRRGSDDGSFYCKLRFDPDTKTFTKMFQPTHKVAFKPLQLPQTIDAMGAAAPQLKINRAGHPCHNCTHGKRPAHRCDKCRCPTKSWRCTSLKQEHRVQRPDRPAGLRRCHRCLHWDKPLVKCMSPTNTQNNKRRQCKLLWCKSCWTNAVAIGDTKDGMELAKDCPVCNRHCKPNTHTMHVPLDWEVGQLVPCTLPSGQQVQVGMPEGAVPGAIIHVPM